MKKYLLLFSLFIVGLSSCQKIDVTNQQAAIDDEKLQAYFKSHNITGLTKDPSGLYYKIEIKGAAPYPTLNSTIQITYTNSYLNGVGLSHVNLLSETLNADIKGLQIGLPHIGTGGRIELYVPSALAYGATDEANIPVNSVLVYVVDLVGFY